VKVGPNAAGVEGSSIYLKAGETWTLEDLLYGLMLQSGNDAAVAIAEHIGGSVDGFLALMNAEADKLGAADTHFTTVNGLDKAAHHTSAYDLAIITAAAMDNADFRRIVASKKATIGEGDVRHSVPNKNKLLFRMEGANGVKTGYTRGAGRCFVGAAQRDGMQLIAVVLNCGPMFEDAQALMEDAFAHYGMVTLLQGGQPLGQADTTWGQRGSVAYGCAQDLSVPLNDEERGRIAVRVEEPDDVQAPVAAGQKLGDVHLILDNNVIGTVPLVAMQDDLRRDWRWCAQRVVEGNIWRTEYSP
jgi:D-alanyl-D-alanine carboxypeptidase (penicillin-binding protein 5/6)